MSDTRAYRERMFGIIMNCVAICAGAISVIVIISVVIIASLGREVPAALVNWGGIILGFYFGQFVTLLKDYMNMKDVNEEGRPE